MAAIANLLFVTSGIAVPSINFSIDAQYPPVARPSQPYSFTFAESTFDTSRGPLSYAIAGQPEWLNLDSSARTFSGTPSSTDIGTASLRLVARDLDGHNSLPISLVVSDRDGPALGDDIRPQLERVGNVTGSATLLLKPGQNLSLKFSATNLSLNNF